MATILLTGPTGFVGSNVLPALLEAGHHVRALVRSDAAGATVLRRLAPAHRAQVELVRGDVTDAGSLGPAVRGADAVIHLVAIARDRNDGRDLARINTTATIDLITAMETEGVRRLIHMGAMSVTDDPRLNYARSKARAEAAVRASSLRWTILKPSLMWGERDGFFNVLAQLVRTSPGIVPVPAGAKSRFQPLAVADLAKVVVMALEREEAVGGSYPLGGPAYWTYKEMLQEVLRGMGKRRLILPMPLPLIKLVARTAEKVGIPFPVASDQLRQLALDNADELGVVRRDWGFDPAPMNGRLGYLRTKPADQETAPGA